MIHSNRNRAVKKSAPPAGFPLWLHPSGRWCKKIRGRVHYFGKADDPQAALNRWLEVKDDLLAGRTPRPKAEDMTVRLLVNAYLSGRKHKVDCGELTPHTFQGYYQTCARIVAELGATRPVSDLRPDDFSRLRASFAKTHGPAFLAKDVQEVRWIFKWGVESGLLEKPPLFGPDFRRPPARVLRQVRNQRSRIFEADELRQIIEAADQPLKAMVLLGINCGFGPADCARLPPSAVNLDAGWIDFPRPKTAIPRRCPLWNETLQVLHDVEKARTAPRTSADADLFFLNREGRSWARDRRQNMLGRNFRQLLKRLGVYRGGLSFNSLRHTFRTIADGALDQPAAAVIMGHVDQGMAAHYRHEISDDRLRRVVDHVRGWLFPPDEEEAPATVPFRARHG